MTRALVLRHHTRGHSGLIGEAFEARGYEIDLRMMNEHSETPSLDGLRRHRDPRFQVRGLRPRGRSRRGSSRAELIAEADARDMPDPRHLFRRPSALSLLRRGREPRRRTARSAGSTSKREAGSGIRRSVVRISLRRCRLPESAELWATSPRAVQAFAIGHHVGVQFHPEIDEAQLKEWFASDEEESRELGLDIEALLEQTAT